MTDHVCHFVPSTYPSHRRPCLSKTVSCVLPGRKGKAGFDLLPVRSTDERTRGPELRLFRSNYGLIDLHLFGAVNMGTRVTAATLVEARDATCCDFQGHRLGMGSANGSLTVFDRAPNETTWQPTASWPAHDTAVAQVLCNQAKARMRHRLSPLSPPQLAAPGACLCAESPFDLSLP